MSRPTARDSTGGGLAKIDLKKRRSLQQVRVRCRPDDVLDGLGYQHRVRKNELFGLCPNPGHDDTTVGTWSMRCEPGSDTNGLAYCFACGWSGDIFDVVKLLAGCDFDQAVDVVRGVQIEVGGDDAAGAVYADELYDEEMQPWLPPEIERPKEVGPIVEGSACWRYLERRGFGVDEVRYYGLGDMVESMRLFVPLKFAGRLVGYVARTYVDAPKKVKFPMGGASGKWGIIGLDRADRSVRLLSLADGWADAFRLRQARRPNPIAACGSALTEEQAWALAWAEQIDVWADGDIGGERLIRDVVGWLGKGRCIRVAMMAPGTDPADKDVETLREIEPVAYSDHRKRRRLNDGDQR